MKNNLVIGSEGFVGKVFCEFLEKKGEKVTRFDIKRGEHEDARFAKLDLDAVDHVYILAWDVGGAKYLYNEDTQLSQLDWNLKLLLNIMPQLGEAKKPFLFISSQLAAEHDTVYGSTKKLGEVWTRILGGIHVRQWNIYGPIEEESMRSHVISDFVQQALTKNEIRMLTTGEEKRQFIHHEDVCEGWYKALNEKHKGSHDITSFEWVKVVDVAHIISKLTGAKVIPGEKVGSTPLTPITGKIPNWHPKVTLEVGLQRMIDELKKKTKNK
jgi:nucleoside-diphosphate-sugar epimerase